MEQAKKKFVPGDVVMLRSGGPTMTVAGEDHVAGKPVVVVVYYDGETKFERLRHEVLELVVGTPKVPEQRPLLPGDVVRTLSGGPAMTVSATMYYEGRLRVGVAYFDAAVPPVLRFDQVFGETLERLEPPGASGARCHPGILVPGDLVRLRSGGPNMTVTRTYETDDGRVIVGVTFWGPRSSKVLESVYSETLVRLAPAAQKTEEPWIHPGDVVRRRDGGPPMMVVATEERAGLTYCCFFDVSKGPKGEMRTSSQFDAEKLVLVERGNFHE